LTIILLLFSYETMVHPTKKLLANVVAKYKPIFIPVEPINHLYTSGEQLTIWVAPFSEPASVPDQGLQSVGALCAPQSLPELPGLDLITMCIDN